MAGVAGNGLSVAEARQDECLRVGVLAGSPHRGNCAHLAREVLAPELQTAGFDVSVRLLADFEIAGCRGCNACAHTGTCVLFAGERGSRTAPRSTLLDLISWLDGLDALVLVAPLYFAGPPAQLKALFDRLQFLWARRYVLKAWPALPVDRRRPALVLAIGGGGDPFGSSALVTCAHSALRMMDFEMELSDAYIGYRSGRTDASGDAPFEERAVERVRELAALLCERGPFARRGQIDPLTRFGR